MKPPKLLRTVFTRAVEIIEKRGWYRGSFIPPGANEKTCPVCIWAALKVATGIGPDYPSIRSPDTEALDFISDLIGTRAWIWQDAEGRKKYQVIAALKRAAKAAGNRRVTP